MKNVSELFNPAGIPLPGNFPPDVYQSSYQRMTAPELEIYHFKDMTYERVLPHVHNHYEFYFFLNGDIQYVVNNRPYNLKRGDFLIIRPGEVHFPDAIPGSEDKVYERAIIWQSKEYFNHVMEVDPSLRALFDLIEETGTCHFRPEMEAFEQINVLLRNMWYEGRAEALGYTIVQKAIFAQILVLLNRIVKEQRIVPQASAAVGDLYMDVIGYIHTHVKDRITLQDLSEQMFVSESYIARVFRQHLGMSVHHYIIRLKLDRIVREALQGGKVSHLAYDYGFQSYSSFFRAFQKEFGEPPKEYIAKLRARMTG